MWPLAAEHLTPAILLQIHHCIRVSKVTVKYRHLCFFLVQRAYCIEQSVTDTKTKKVAHDANKITERGLKDDISPREVPQTKSGMLTDLVDARADRLEEINRLSDLKLKVLLALQETRITGESATASTEPAGKEGHYFDRRSAETTAASSASDSRIFQLLMEVFVGRWRRRTKCAQTSWSSWQKYTNRRFTRISRVSRFSRRAYSGKPGRQRSEIPQR